MNGSRLDRLVLAELVKLSSRSSVRLGLILMVAVAVFTSGLLMVVEQSVELRDTSGMLPPDPGAAAAPVAPAAAASGEHAFDFTVVDAMGWSLWVRNLFLFRLLLIAVISVVIAGEFSGRTLREDLLRPVSRSAVLAAKWLAISAFVVLAALLPYVVSAGMGIVIFGPGEGLGDTTTQYALSVIGDLGFMTLVMAIALAVRSVPGTIGGVMLYWVVDQLLGWSLGLAKGFKSLVEGQMVLPPWFENLVALRPWLPSSAFNVHEGYGTPLAATWESYVALGVITVVAYVVADRVFDRIDVP